MAHVNVPYADQSYFIIGCGRKLVEPPVQPVAEKLLDNPQIIVNWHTHEVGFHCCNLAVPLRLPKSERNGPTLQLNPRELIEGASSTFESKKDNEILSIAGFRIPALTTYTLDIGADLNPHIVSDWRGSLAMKEYGRMAGKLHLVYFESLPNLFKTPPNPHEVSYQQVMTALVHALRPGGVMILRMQGLDGMLDQFEQYLNDVATQLQHFHNDNQDQDGTKPYFVFRDVYEIVVDVRLVKNL